MSLDEPLICLIQVKMPFSGKSGWHRIYLSFTYPAAIELAHETPRSWIIQSDLGNLQPAGSEIMLETFSLL